MKNSVGYCSVTLKDPHDNIDYPMHVMYPCAATEHDEQLGAFTLNLAKNAKLKSGIYPLVIFMHKTQIAFAFFDNQLYLVDSYRFTHYSSATCLTCLAPKMASAS